MAAVWTRLLLLGVFVAIAHGLTCRRCPLSVSGRCLIGRDDVQCDNSTSRCFNATTTLSGTSSIQLQSQGCVLAIACDRVAEDIFTGLNISIACCQTNLCNGGPLVQLSRAAACVAMLASLWTR